MRNAVASIKAISKLLAEHWVLLSGFAFVYVYFISLNSSYLYYREFGIDTFLYFSLSDYPRILMADNKILLQPILVFILVFSALTFKEITRYEERRVVVSRFFSSLSVIFWLSTAFVVFFLPGFHSWGIAEGVKNKSSVTVMLKSKIFREVYAVGSTSEYLFLFNSKDMTSVVLPKNQVKEIIHNNRIQPTGG